MATTNKGAIAVMALFCGSGTVAPFNAANSRVGVGDSAAAFDPAQTDLQAVANKLRKLVSAVSYVSGNNYADYTALFDLSEALYAWSEVGLFNSSSGDYMATRRTLSGFGTKPNNEAWTMIITVVSTAA